MNKFFFIVKAVILITIIVFIAFLIGYNVTTKVNVNYLFGEIADVSLIIIILASFFAGIFFMIFFWSISSILGFFKYKKKLNRELKMKKSVFLADKSKSEK